MRMLLIILALAACGGIFFEILHHGRLPGDVGSIAEMLVQGLVAAGITGLLGPFFLVRRDSPRLKMIGVTLWLMGTLILQFVVYWSMTCCGT